jgi:type I restriction enzyme R subunit
MQNILQKDNLDVINEKREAILKVFQDAFWNDLSFDDVEFIIKELAPLVRYYEPNPKKVIQVDAPDTILKVEQFEHAVKEDDELKKFLESNPLVKKIKDGEGLTAHQLLNLIQELNKIRPEITIENIEMKIYNASISLFLSEKLLG